jgi:hypothetical protein
MTTPVLKTSTVRPGLLVIMKTSIIGNMKYTSATKENKTLEDGAKFTKWEGTCTVADPAEQERASKVRSNASGYVISSCLYTGFGLLCPDDKVDAFREALAKARAEVDAFNETANYSYIKFYVMVGRIAANDMEAREAIASELGSLINTMETGVKNADVKVIRDAAYAARQLGGMLTDEMRESIKEVIDMARSAASKYAKAGEKAAKEIDLATVKELSKRRSAFLDLSGIEEVKAPVKGSKRAVELTMAESVAEEQKPKKVKATPKIEVANQPAAVAAPRKRKAAQLDIEDAINNEVGAANSRIKAKGKKTKASRAQAPA